MKLFVVLTELRRGYGVPASSAHRAAQKLTNALDLAPGSRMTIDTARGVHGFELTANGVVQPRGRVTVTRFLTH